METVDIWEKAVSEAEKNNVPILMLIQSYNKEEAKLFYTRALYAAEKGVEIRLVPKFDK
jgi:hypothetical protein